MKFHFLSSNNSEAKNTEKKLTKLYGQNSVENADYIIPIGGDGLLQHHFRQYIHGVYSSENRIKGGSLAHLKKSGMFPI